MMIDEIKQLLRELEYHMNYTGSATDVARLESKLEKYRKKSAKHLQDLQDLQNLHYVPYPDREDARFASDIYNKKEFNDAKIAKQVAVLDLEKESLARCRGSGPVEFNLTHNQKFLRNFMSPNTPYNGILLYHGVGVGKCFAKGTPILMFDGRWRAVEDVELGEIVMGDDSTPRRVLNTVSGRANLFRIRSRCPSVRDFVVNGDHILCLRDDKGLTQEISVNDYVAMPEWYKRAFHGYRARSVFYMSSSTFDSAKYIDHLCFDYGNGNVTGGEPMPDNIRYSWPGGRASVVVGYIDAHRWDRADALSDYVRVPYNAYIHEIAASIGIACVHEGNDLRMWGSAVERVTPYDSPPAARAREACSFEFDVVEEPGGEQTYYGFGVDGNHKFIIQDFVVTHNSCSAITIAEQFRNLFAKQTLILMPSSLKENFKKQIFDIGKPLASCGSKYYYDHETMSNMTKEHITKIVDRRIRKRYEFHAFLEFAYSITKDLDAMTPAQLQQMYRMIREKYSNRVIIIDEVHNIRDEADSKTKRVPAIMRLVLRYATNVKLVLLSATPMYNDAREIVEIMNLLLANDKRPLLSESDVFEDGKLVSADKLREACTGYVSYMRGENPVTFPRLFQPTYVESELSALQDAALKNVDDGQVHHTTLSQLNIVGVPNIYSSAFVEKNAEPLLIEYAPGVTPFMQYNHLSMYAPKIKAIMDRVIKADGIVLIYTFFLEYGVIPIALALEHLGFSKYGGNNMLVGSSSSRPHSYCILNRQKKYNSKFDDTLNVLKSAANKDGKEIKIILMTSVAAEGIDLKNVREVHIVEPWWHMNRSEQIIGRAVRQCSHIDLPIEKRNVTVFHHVATPYKNKDGEKTMDQDMVERAMRKQVEIDKVQTVLRESAVDCSINREGMVFDPNALKFNYRMTTSQNEIVDVRLGDESSKYQKVNCPRIHERGELDRSTYSREYFVEEIDSAIKDVKRIFEPAGVVVMKFKRLREKLDTVDKIHLIYALDKMVKDKVPIKSSSGYLIFRAGCYIFQPNNAPDEMIVLDKRTPVYDNKLPVIPLVAPEIELDLAEVGDADVKRLRAEVEKGGAANFGDAAYVGYIVDRLASIEQILHTVRTWPAARASLQHRISGEYMQNPFNVDEYRHIGTGAIASALEKDTITPVSVETAAGHLGMIGMKISPSGPVFEFKIFRNLNGASSSSSSSAIGLGTVCESATTQQIKEVLKLAGDRAKKTVRNIPDKKKQLCIFYELCLREFGYFSRRIRVK